MLTPNFTRNGYWLPMGSQFCKISAVSQGQLKRARSVGLGHCRVGGVSECNLVRASLYRLLVMAQIAEFFRIAEFFHFQAFELLAIRL